MTAIDEGMRARFFTTEEVQRNNRGDRIEELRERLRARAMREEAVEERERTLEARERELMEAREQYKFDPWSTGEAETHKYKVGDVMEVKEGWGNNFVHPGDKVKIVALAGHDDHGLSLYQLERMRDGEMGACHAQFIKPFIQAHLDEDLFKI